MARLAELSFTKGHGTRNDFILIQDTSGQWYPSEEHIRWLCDRRQGLGADGVIRVVPTKLMPEFMDLAIAPWFMDYRNADGSIAEMCGNGARVFARYLVASGAESSKEFVIATRAGLHEVEIHSDLSVSISMGMARGISSLEPVVVVVPAHQLELPAIGVLMPNPHAVAFLPQHLDLEGLDLEGLDLERLDLERLDLRNLTVNPAGAFPEGVNIELVQRLGPNHVAMRVVERGSGETMSCGTGACAVAWVDMENSSAVNGETRVDVPGGTLWVRAAGNQLWLRGPADLVARGRILLPPLLL